MAARPPTGPGKLPPPPAPTARDANPWKFSPTARTAEPREQTLYERLVAEVERAQAEQQGPAAPPSAAESRRGQEPSPPKGESSFNRIFPFVILLIMFGSFAREVIEEGGRGDPRLLPLLAVLLFAVFVVAMVALRRARRRRRRSG